MGGLLVNRHIFKINFYDRNKGVLFKSDYVFMRESLEKYLDQKNTFADL